MENAQAATQAETRVGLLTGLGRGGGGAGGAAGAARCKPSSEEPPFPPRRQMNRNLCFQFVDIDKLESN